MLLEFSGQTINNFIIPPFTIAQGEIVIIKLPSGPYFYSLESDIVNLLTGKTISENLKMNASFKFVEHLKESWIRYHFSPTTIKTYHRQHANEANLIYKKVYDISWIKPEIKIKTLPGNIIKRLSLYTTLSWTNYIILDLAAVDPQSGEDIYEFVKTLANNGGAAILIDHCDEFKNDCTSFIKAEYIDAR